MPGEHEGHRQRMRERFLATGLDGFADHEVLELLLFYAIPRRDTNPLAHRLIENFGSLHAVLDTPAEQLECVEGMGANAAALLSLFSQTARRLDKSRIAEREKLNNRAAAKRHCQKLFRGLREEHFYAVCLNGQLQVLGDALISRGTLNEVQAYPRHVAEVLLRHNAHTVMFCHNHPGGSVVPSAQDMQVTQILGDLCANLGVVMADHLIVTDADVLSMVECGLISMKKEKSDLVEVRVADNAGEILIGSKLKNREGKKHRICEKASG